MTDSAQTARLFASGFSELMNCSGYVLLHASPPPEILRALSDACDKLLRVHTTSTNLQGPANVDLAAVFAVVEQLRDALPDRDLERVPALCRDLFAALGVPTPTTAA